MAQGQAQKARRGGGAQPLGRQNKAGKSLTTPKRQRTSGVGGKSLYPLDPSSFWVICQAKAMLNRSDAAKSEAVQARHSCIKGNKKISEIHRPFVTQAPVLTSGMLRPSVPKVQVAPWEVSLRLTLRLIKGPRNCTQLRASRWRVASMAVAGYTGSARSKRSVHGPPVRGHEPVRYTR